MISTWGMARRRLMIYSSFFVAHQQGVAARAAVRRVPAVYGRSRCSRRSVFSGLRSRAGRRSGGACSGGSISRHMSVIRNSTGRGNGCVRPGTGESLSSCRGSSRSAGERFQLLDGGNGPQADRSADFPDQVKGQVVGRDLAMRSQFLSDSRMPPPSAVSLRHFLAHHLVSILFFTCQCQSFHCWSVTSGKNSLFCGSLRV